MHDIFLSLQLAFSMLFNLDANLIEIINLSLQVSIFSVIGACILGLPTGAILAIGNFRGRQTAIIITNALMGLPPVVVGLMVYLVLSRSGPLGWLGLLYTPTAMIIAQVILITPIIAALSREILSQIHLEYDEQFRSLNVPRMLAIKTLLWDSRYNLLTVGLVGFGRSVSEVGAVIIVGGNIEHLTRVMTTAIALETSKGNLALALALGIILITIALSINLIAYFFKYKIQDFSPIN